MTATQTSSRNGHRPSATRKIPVRHLQDRHVDHEMDQWIVPDDPIFSHFLATLSAVFPKGEEFFVASVRAHRDAIKDNAVLKAQVKGFIGQEALHSKEHRDINARLAKMGYHTVRADKTIGRLVDFISHIPPSTLPIAATAAAEHYTGLLGESVLSDEKTRQTLFGQEAILPLIEWHSLEEIEHKNVAFDVMKAAGAGYPVRVGGFLATTGVLVTYIVIEWGRAVWEDRGVITAEHRRTFLRNLGNQKLLSPWLVRNVLKYLRPGFHPDDTNTDGLLEEWKVRLSDVATPAPTKR